MEMKMKKNKIMKMVINKKKDNENNGKENQK